MLTAGITLDTGKNLLRVAIHQADATGHVELHCSKNVVRINSSVSARLLPGFAGLIGVFIFLQPDASFRKKVHAVRVVPMHVRDHHVSNIFRRKRGLPGRHDARLADSFRGFHEAIHLELLEKLRTIEAGIDQNVVAVAANEPYGHSNRKFALRVGAGDERIDGEVWNGSVADGKHFIDWGCRRWRGLSDYRNTCKK